jgi:hypothetical protein
MNDSRSLIRYSVSLVRIEHQNMIERRPPTLASIRARNNPFEVGTKQLKIDQPLQPIEIVALC